jgi:hypothetical protein
MFSLGQNTAQPPPSMTQPELHYKDIIGGNNAAATRPQSSQGGPQGEIANMRAPETGVGAALATATGTTTYSGFNNAIQKWGIGTEASIARDLKWQCDVDGKALKATQFKEVVGGLQDFRTYLFMKPRSAFVTVCTPP